MYDIDITMSFNEVRDVESIPRRTGNGAYHAVAVPLMADRQTAAVMN